MKTPKLLLLAGLAGLAASAQAQLVFTENFNSATPQPYTSTTNPLSSDFNFATSNQAGISASGGISNTQGLLPGGPSGGAAAVETQFVYNATAINFTALTLGDSNSAVRMGIYFLNPSGSTSSVAYPELGLQATPTSYINPAPGVTDQNVSMRLNGNNDTPTIQLRAMNGTRGATAASPTLTDGNWYYFQVDFWRFSATEVKGTATIFNSDSSGVLGSTVTSFTSDAWTFSAGGTSGIAQDSTTYAILRLNANPEAGVVDPIVDNWSVSVVPEPTTWALLAGGLTSLMVFRRNCSGVRQEKMFKKELYP
jgi:hypothetical protein